MITFFHLFIPLNFSIQSPLLSLNYPLFRKSGYQDLLRTKSQSVLQDTETFKDQSLLILNVCFCTLSFFNELLNLSSVLESFPTKFSFICKYMYVYIFFLAILPDRSALCEEHNNSLIHLK